MAKYCERCGEPITSNDSYGQLTVVYEPGEPEHATEYWLHARCLAPLELNDR